MMRYVLIIVLSIIPFLSSFTLPLSRPPLRLDFALKAKSSSTVDVIIVGGGLSGLCTGSLLAQTDKNVSLPGYMLINITIDAIRRKERKDKITIDIEVA
jgi:hypothetical protein